MIDLGLIVSVIAIFASVELVSAFWPPLTFAEAPTTATFWPVLIGVFVGRLVSMLLDDPGGLDGLRALTSIRGGVEFWPGLVAGLLIVAWQARRNGVDVVERMADIAPYGLVGAAAYQATCLVREGCYGPDSAIGIAPHGLGGPVVPVEIVGAIILVAVAIVMLRHRTRLRPPLVVAGVLALLSLQRAVVSIWLPVVGDGLSRAHRESIGVAFGSGVAVLWVLARGGVPEHAATASATARDEQL